MDFESIIAEVVNSIGADAVANQLLPGPMAKFLELIKCLEMETMQKVIPEIGEPGVLNKCIQDDERSIIASIIQSVSPGLQVEVLLQFSEHPCQDETSLLMQILALSPQNQSEALMGILQKPGNKLLQNLSLQDGSQETEQLKTLIATLTPQPQNSGVVVGNGLTDLCNEGLRTLKKQEDEIHEEIRRQEALNAQVAPTAIKKEPVTPMLTTSNTSTSNVALYSSIGANDLVLRSLEC